ncbi:uncharacterized protein LOC113400075 [Vanessa tameamea]|uniref:Uncharacterized protein LOC113400075 n=1 Tax=Vanessa tameamea TaxID=334116 RepID=A0A8B8IDV7_VANTA
MNKFGTSPSFKNLKTKKIQSPVQLKEKIRNDYKNNLKTCRDKLLNRIRGVTVEADLRLTLTDIYNNTFNNFNKDDIEIEQITDNEETKILEEIKNELIQNELNWWIEEYEKSESDTIDWSTIQKDDTVICFLCQKNNFTLANKRLSCSLCNTEIKTEMSLANIKKHINESIERHSNMCNGSIQFMSVPESCGTHIYLFCENCMDMQFIV